MKEPAASTTRLLATLLGDHITRVVYREVSTHDGEPGYVASDYHRLAFGVELHLGSGRVVSFIWLWPVSYFLGAIEGDLSGEVVGGHFVWDVSTVAPWPSLIGRKIQAIHLEWFQDEEEAEGDYPLTAKLIIDPNIPVYISLGVEMIDELAVLFSDDVARAYGRYFDMSGIRIRRLG